MELACFGVTEKNISTMQAQKAGENISRLEGCNSYDVVNMNSPSIRRAV